MLSKASGKLWNVFFFVWKMLWYSIAVIIMFRILQMNWLVFMLICIIIIMANPGYFKD